ncbi:hypothetical protein QBC42DRAFT_1513 [Cladorrhinum samala]|uniref:RING-type E3 ubiquitin transferase n=1 Tax=Cladorrhinum samala TaxID=585594 RepID=A0AAV9I7R8_9PEZI|nr:hypothetical protein QBC42DRAFT_1513 [Cladorrhinum samala]
MPPPQQEQQQQARRQQESGQVLLFLIFVYFFLFSGNDSPALLNNPFSGANRLGRQRAAFGILNSTNYGDFSPKEKENLPGDPPWEAPHYLNLTGFRETDGYAWEDLHYFKTRCHQWSKNAYPPREGAKEWWDHSSGKRTWQNATGAVQGKWVRRQGSTVKVAAGYNLSAIAPGVDWLDSHAEWGWNVTGSRGTVLVRLRESDADDKVYRETPEKDTDPHPASIAREISAVVTFQDEDKNSAAFALRAHGVHWPIQGSMILTTTSEKFAGIFGLPHLAPGAEFFRTSQKLLNHTLDKVLRKKERSRFVDPSNPWNPVVEEDTGEPLPRCEYIMYLQLYQLDPQYFRDGPSITKTAGSPVDALERELRFPTGASGKKTPELHMSLVAWSPDCSYYIESKGPPLFPSDEGHHLVGVKEEVLLSRANHSLLAFTFIFLGQIYFLKSQVKESPTPSTLSRLSFYTMAIMLLADTLVVTCSLTWSFSAVTTFQPSMLLTFVSFLSASIGGGFLGSIYTNNPERRAREREREQNRNANNNTNPDAPGAATAPTTATPAVASSAQPSGSLPLPATAVPARPPSPPIIIPSDQDIDAEIAEVTAAGATAVAGNANAGRTPPRNPFGTIGLYFALIITALLIITAISLSWPPRARAIYFNTVAFSYFSLWCPQIWRNARRNSRRSFSWGFIIGQSLCRLLPFAYFYLWDGNFLFVDTDSVAFAFLVGWVWLQIVLMVAQEVWEPRLGIPFPTGWMPEVWDYHRILRQEDIESGMVLIGSEVESVSGSSGGGGGQHLRERSKELKQRGMMLRSVDCAICRDEMFVPVVIAGRDDPSWSMADMMERKQYMITPCRHMFHTKCLEQWFRKRLVCPICREDLQPL